MKGTPIKERLPEIPPELRWDQPLRLPPALAESELTARLLELAAPNTHLDEAVCFLGGGVADHYVPAIVDSIAAAVGPQPVGPDAPQPLLQLVFELQTLFASLTGLDAASAPLADGPTAFAEAIRMACQATGRSEAVLARSLSPDYRAIARTLLAAPAPGGAGVRPPYGGLEAYATELREAGYHGGVIRADELERLLSDRTACLAVEQPNFFGCLEDLAALAAAAHQHGALLVAKVDPISLGILKSPGEVGADIAVADAQPLGRRPAYGGSLGLLAARAPLKSRLPGWRVERAADGFQALGQATGRLRADLVARPVAYLAAVGPQGLAEAAALCVRLAHEAQRRLCGIEGFDPRFRAPFFKEFVVESEHDADEIAEALLQSNILGALALQPYYPEMERCLLFAVTERRTKADLDLLCHALDLLADAEGFDTDLDPEARNEDE